jgi:hypothetical protein
LANRDSGVLRGGFSLVVRHQRILWWVFAVNLVLGGLGASSTARAVGSALHHSLAGEKLTNHFDLGMFMELVSQPDVKLFSHSGSVLLFACVYFVFLLFITPGIISAFLHDQRLTGGEFMAFFENQRLTTGEFFGAGGTFFWAFVRLALWSLIPFIVADLLHQAAHALANYAGDRAIADQTGFYILLIGSIPGLLLFVWVRLWFDLAQVRTVALNELRTRRDVAHTFELALRRTWRVYWSYIFIGILMSVVTAVALLVWTRAPGRAVPVTFLLLEVIMLAQIFGRLWQKACATAWYRLNPGPSVPPAEATPFEPPVLVPKSSSPDSVPDVDAPLSPEVEGTPEHNKTLLP